MFTDRIWNFSLNFMEKSKWKSVSHITAVRHTHLYFPSCFTALMFCSLSKLLLKMQLQVNTPFYFSIDTPWYTAPSTPLSLTRPITILFYLTFNITTVFPSVFLSLNMSAYAIIIPTYISFNACFKAPLSLSLHFSVTHTHTLHRSYYSLFLYQSSLKKFIYVFTVVNLSGHQWKCFLCLFLL